MGADEPDAHGGASEGVNGFVEEPEEKEGGDGEGEDLGGAGGVQGGGHLDFLRVEGAVMGWGGVVRAGWVGRGAVGGQELERGTRFGRGPTHPTRGRRG